MKSRRYPATFVRAIDGDTLVMSVDIGFYLTSRRPIRLYGVNCPEKTGKTKAAGLAAKAFTEQWFAERQSKVFETITYKPREEDVHGRYLARVYVEGSDEPSLNEALIAAGHAVEAFYK